MYRGCKENSVAMTCFQSKLSAKVLLNALRRKLILNKVIYHNLLLGMPGK